MDQIGSKLTQNVVEELKSDELNEENKGIL